MEIHTNDHEKESKKIVYVIDTDTSLQKHIAEFLTSSIVIVKTFTSVEDFLANSPSKTPGCLIVGTDLTGMSAIDLMYELKALQISLPFIILGNKNDITQAVKYMRAGAVDFLDKPFTDQKLLRTCMRLMNKFEP